MSGVFSRLKIYSIEKKSVVKSLFALKPPIFLKNELFY